MKLNAKIRLSRYIEITDVDSEKNIKLVQHRESGEIFVLKTLKIFDFGVYAFLMDNPMQGISNIIEIIEDGDILYVIEEYITGKSMRALLNNQGILPENKAVDYICQLCNILKPLHELDAPIVHRDIKPSNLIITKNRNLILVDFNAAKDVVDDKDKDTILFGTPGYAAPEQYGFGVSQTTADIYAIGIVLNELLTGKLSRDEIYPGKLKHIIEKCIEMKPEDRFGSVVELYDALTDQPKSNKSHSKLREWLPPGMNNKNPVVAVMWSFWYVLIVYMCLTTNLDDFLDIQNDIIKRIVYFYVLFTETLLIGNYRNIRSKLPLCNNKKKAVRVWGTVLWAFLIMLPIVIIQMIIETIV